MNMIAYPITEGHITPHIGRCVAVMTHEGDVACGIIDRVHEGHLVMRPAEGVMPAAAIAQIKKTVKNNPEFKKMAEKVKTQAYYGGGYGGYGRYPYGWGYGNYGWGAGWWWIFPLFWLTAIAATGFLW